jgi:hypothetical protein
MKLNIVYKKEKKNGLSGIFKNIPIMKVKVKQ